MVLSARVVNMRCIGHSFGCLILISVALLAGCNNKPKGQTSSADDEKAIEETFKAFQAALEARDADKKWALLDSDSRDDAERAAKAIRDSYAKASAEQKAEQEKSLGLPGAELAALTGAGFLKTKRFHGKYHEVPGSKIKNVTVEGDTAKVDYIEEDGDKETMKLVRQDGKWKLSLKMP
jgi:hypothetical protein